MKLNWPIFLILLAMFPGYVVASSNTAQLSEEADQEYCEQAADDEGLEGDDVVHDFVVKCLEELLTAARDGIDISDIPHGYHE